MKPTQFELATIAANLRSGTPDDKIASALELWEASGRLLNVDQSEETDSDIAAPPLSELNIQRQIKLFESSFPNGAAEADGKFLRILMPFTKREKTRSDLWEKYYYGVMVKEDMKEIFPFPICHFKFEEMLRDYNQAYHEYGDYWRKSLAKDHGRKGSIKKRWGSKK